MEKDAQFFEKARERKSAAESYWSQIFKDYEEDGRFYADLQWTRDQLDAREAAGRPALTFNQVKQPVLRQINELRQNKPAIKINPKSLDADAETAEFFEGKIRSIEYESQADIARMHAAKCAGIGGIGFYRVCTKYVDDDSTSPSFEQDMFVDAILDPRMVLYDPNTEKFDFSDAQYCFVVPKPIPWDEYEKKYPHASKQSWDADDQEAKDWSTEDSVTVAEYWHIEKKAATLIQLQSGEIGYEYEFSEEELKPENVLHRRAVDRKVVHFDLINGVETLEETIWPGSTIPILPVLGDMLIVEQKRVLAGMIRSARDAQILLNAYFSGEAEAIGLTNRVPYIGPRGSFKSDPNWQNAHVKNPPYLEYDPVYDSNGQLIPDRPQRQTAEAAVQALSNASMQMVDTIKRAMGYADDTISPSKQADLSGVAISRRTMQQDNANFHISDSLSLAMWREGKIYLEVLPAIHDTPKGLQVMSEAGDLSTHYVTQADEDGNVPLVPGAEQQPHHRLDKGKFGVTVTVGPSYSTKIEEESDFLTQILGSDPQLVTAFLDVIFKMRGYPDLEERAKMMLPPQIQQGIQAAAQGQQPNPQAQALMGQNAQLQQQIKALLIERLTKKYQIDQKMQSDLLKAFTTMFSAVTTAKTQTDLGTIDARMQNMSHVLDALEAAHDAQISAEQSRVSQMQAAQPPVAPSVPGTAPGV